MSLGGGFFNYFVMELGDGVAQNVKNGAPAVREVIVPSAALALTHGDRRAQPTISLQSFQEWIEGARADVIAVTPQLAQYPLTDNRMFGGMMKNVDLPEPEQDLARQPFGVKRCHGSGPQRIIITITVNEYENERG
jgi:hypothetical protein